MLERRFPGSSLVPVSFCEICNCLRACGIPMYYAHAEIRPMQKLVLIWTLEVTDD